MSPTWPAGGQSSSLGAWRGVRTLKVLHTQIFSIAVSIVTCAVRVARMMACAQLQNRLMMHAQVGGKTTYDIMLINLSTSEAML